MQVNLINPLEVKIFSFDIAMATACITRYLHRHSYAFLYLARCEILQLIIACIAVKRMITVAMGAGKLT